LAKGFVQGWKYAAASDLDPGWVQKAYGRTDPDLNKFSNFDKVAFDPPFMAFHFSTVGLSDDWYRCNPSLP
jgi:hypothetical protein